MDDQRTAQAVLDQWDGRSLRQQPEVTRDPIAGNNTIMSWSFSALYWYELCPAKFYWERIAKLPTKKKAYFEKGNEAHRAAEKYVESKGEIRPLPDSIRYNREFLAEVARHTGGASYTIEQKWGFTKSYKPTDWIGQHTYFRMVMDWSVDYGDGAAEMVDWKTGKMWASNKDEMACFAMGYFHRMPHIQRLTTRLVYFSSNNQDLEEWDRSQLPALTAHFEQRAARLFEERQWLPRPNDRCRQCDFSKKDGGPCRYG